MTCQWIYSAATALLLMGTLTAQGADHRIEPLNEVAPAKTISDEVAAQLAPNGYRVIRGASTTYCDIWLCKQWSAVPDFQPTSEILYPFQPGQLIGVIRFARKGSDFRDQDISTGMYVLRYAQQPVDGAHVGTSPTRDFLLLVRADDDQSAANTELSELNERSAAAAESSHPCMLAMQRVVASDMSPSMRHVEATDWWIAGVKGSTAGNPPAELALEFVIVGQAAE